ncbi:MAG: UPF0182 family protein [Gemmatimonadota bacterium]
MIGTRGRLLLYGGLILVGLLVAGQLAVEFYAELGWFRSLGYSSRFWRLELARLASWLAVVGAAAATLFAVLWGIARRVGPIQVRRRLGDLVIAEALPKRQVRVATMAVAVVAALLVAAPVAGTLAERVLFLAHAPAWGAPDPVLGRDPRFYVFLLPTLRTLWSLALSLFVWMALAVTAIFSVTGRIQTGPKTLRVEPFARRRLAALGAAALFLMAAHFGLSAFEAVSSGPITYATVYGAIPARRLVAVLALLAAVVLLYSERTGKWNLALSALGVLAVVWPVGVGIYPDLIQRFRVDPNELELERPFIAANVAATRTAFAVHDLVERPYRVDDRPPELEVVRRWTAGLPLWDERPLQATYNQLQGLLAYHEFPDVDNDRYGPPGRQEQVAIAVREFSPGRLAASARTWLNLHLRYTHGQGAVASPADRVTSGGEPEYFLRDLPPLVSPDAPEGIEIHEPRVYFGERSTQYVIVPVDSMPEGLAAVGVPIDSPLRRLAFAWALGSKNVFLRRPTEGSAVLMWRRQVVERVQRLVPFLLVDPDPVPVIDEGRIKWLLDIYAVTSRFSLAQSAELRGERVNYVRDAVKAVVDGVTGEVRFYALSPSDPLLRTFASAFPGLFLDRERMPESLRRHLRYPRALLRVQAQILEAYHLVEPEEFYRAQDLWSLAKEVYQGRPAPVEPYYLLMPFPGAEGSVPEFLLTVPFTPRNRDNLAAFLIVRNDGEHYGELALFRAAALRQLFGPRQVEVQIDQDPIISQQLSLWRQLGSRATRGHLLLVPVEGFLLYVEPLFLEAEDQEGAAPGLKRVIASAGDRVAMSETLEGALRSLFGPVPLSEAPSPAVAERPEDTAPGRPAISGLVERLRAADEALRRGDLGTFAEIWEEIRAWIETGGAGPTERAAGGRTESQARVRPEKRPELPADSLEGLP